MLLMICIFYVVVTLLAFLLYRKKKIISLILFSIPMFTILLIGGWWIYESNYQFISNTDLSQEQLGMLTLNQPIEELEDYKDPTLTPVENVYYPIFVRSSQLMLGANEDGLLEYVRTSSTNKPTNKEINVTQTLHKVIETYGKSYYSNKEMGMGQYIGYVDRKNKRELRFWHEDGIVTEIEYKHL
ncbi:hypothetical protein [Bacillus sp. JJ722]|uniref:hypothetical protein n=1 Tax=Bacillus sp. JJ722 TaxID=3122973 RepID=UPI002FFDE604